MKKLFVILILAGIAYGTYMYLQKVKDETAKKGDVLKPSEKALKESEKEDGK